MKLNDVERFTGAEKDGHESKKRRGRGKDRGREGGRKGGRKEKEKGRR